MPAALVACLAVLTALPLGACAPVPRPSGDADLSAYKDLALPFAGPSDLANAGRAGTLILAFATGACGAEVLPTGSGSRFMADLGSRLVQQHIRYVIATGGQGGLFSCDSDVDMETFLQHYASPMLAGLDLDIEAGQTGQQIESLLATVAKAQTRHPDLRVMLTLPTFAAADGSGASLGPLGVTVLAKARAAGMRNVRVNLMVMDYGQPDPSHCVVDAHGACDMGRSAEQAADNLHRGFAVDYESIELTAMVGVNDTPGNVFSPLDARRVAAYARRVGLGGLHYWSMDRDRPCADTQARPDCSGLAGVRQGGFDAAFRGSPVTGSQE